MDEKWNPIPGTEEIIPCDTLLLSVGLIPENELSRQAGVLIDPVTAGPYVDDGFQTNIPGIFSAGNVVHVYDLVDWVTEAGFIAGKSAARLDTREGIQTRKSHPGETRGECAVCCAAHAQSGSPGRWGDQGPDASAATDRITGLGGSTQRRQSPS